MSAVINNKIVYKDTNLNGKYGSVLPRGEKYYIYYDSEKITEDNKDIKQVINHELWHIVFMQYKTITNQEQIVRIITEYQDWVSNEANTFE